LLDVLKCYQSKLFLYFVGTARVKTGVKLNQRGVIEQRLFYQHSKALLFNFVACHVHYF
jgi:hypothetical protein